MTFKKIIKSVAFILLIKVVASTISNDIQASSDEVDPDPEMESYLREALENFREQMKIGIDAISMPVLDPLELQNIDVQVKENLAEVDLKIKKIYIEDLSTFKLHEINANLEKLHLKLKLSFPKIKALGNYSLQGKMLKIFPLHGDGKFSINLTQAEIAGLGKLSIKDDILQVNKLDLDLSWNSLTIFLENFLGGGKFANVVQNMLPHVGKTVFETYKSEILGKLNSALQNALNNELQKRTVREILDKIIPKEQ